MHRGGAVLLAAQRMITVIMPVVSETFCAYMTVEPWDLLQGGIGDVLDRVQGELGVDGVQTTVVAGSVHEFRTRSDMLPRTFRCDAGVYYRPSAGFFGDTRLKPSPVAWIKSRDPLEQIADDCMQRGLRLRVRVVALDNPTLAHRHAFAACKDVYGDASPARLCPANPDVKGYLVALLADLTARYQIDAIDLCEADYGPADMMFPGRQSPADGEWRRRHACFCESCRQLASASGLDVRELLRHMADDESTSSELPPTFATYLNLQRAAVGTLWTMAATASKARVWLEWEGRIVERQGAIERIPSQVHGVIEGGTGIAIDPALRSKPFPAHLAIGVRHALGAHVPLTTGADDLVRRVLADGAAEKRVAIFSAYGTAPIERLEWVRQAVRFARREFNAHSEA